MGVEGMSVVNKALIFNKLNPEDQERITNSPNSQELISFEGSDYTLYDLRGIINENQREYGESPISFGPGINNNYEHYPPLKPIPSSIKKIELDPDLNRGAVIKSVSKSKSFLKEPSRFEGGEEPKPKWVTGLDLFNMMSEKLPTLIGDIIPQEGLVALVGSSDTGKSMMLRQLAVNIVRDSHFLNFQIHARYKSVAIISTEDDSKSLAFLIRRQAGRSDCLENIHVFFESENVIEELDIFLADHPVDAVIADAWGDVYSGNQVDSGQIRQALNRYKTLSNKYGCVIIFLHHTGKRTQKLAPSKDNILSGQGFEAKMRLVLELRNDQEDPDFRHLCVVKGNYLGKEFKNASFKLAMDEDTFLFHDTGERISFDNLATVSDDGKAVKTQPKKANEVDYITHKNILEQVFANGLKPKLKDLQTRISAKYGDAFGTTFGGRRVDAYLDYFINDVKWIIKVGKDRSPNAHYYLGEVSATDNAAEYVSS